MIEDQKMLTIVCICIHSQLDDCIAAFLDSAINGSLVNKCRHLVNIFHLSEMIKKALYDHPQDTTTITDRHTDIPELDRKNQWLTTYRMLKQLHQLQASVCSIISRLTPFQHYNLTNNEWHLLEALVTKLQSLRKETKSYYSHSVDCFYLPVNMILPFF